MEMAAVSAATRVLGPVVGKLAALLSGDASTLQEGSRRDIEFIKSKLEGVHSLLPRMWGISDLDARPGCKDWMMEARELSYDMEDAIDDFEQQRTSEIPFEELKTRVSMLSNEMSKTVEAISNSGKPVQVVDPRSRFLHGDASELVGMEVLKHELVRLVVEGVDPQGDPSRRRIVTPRQLRHAATATPTDHKRIVIRLSIMSGSDRSKVMQAVANVRGVESTAFRDGKAELYLVVVGRMDRADLMSTIKKSGTSPAHIVSVGPTRLVQEQASEAKKPAAAHGSDEIKTVCILGFAGGGKTALAELVYRAAEEHFGCRAFVSVSPSPNIPGILRAILTQVTDGQPAMVGTEDAGKHYFSHEISKFLADKRYLVIIDDVWHFKDWEIIRKSLPKNNPGSRIIITTRINAIAEKCQTEDNDIFVYEIAPLEFIDARMLSNTAVKKSVARQTPRIFDDYPWYDIIEFCRGMPLAIICISSAVAEQTEGLLDGKMKILRALRHFEHGLLNIPSLKPLAESLCLGYNDLPLYLRTSLLYCSIYSLQGRFERDRLVRRWLAERFVQKEEAAEDNFDELVDREWIKQVGDGKYEIHPVMLAFLRCKSQEDNFVTCLVFCPDIPSTYPRRIRRLCLQHGHSVDLSGMDLSRTRSLSVFGTTCTVPFKQFERLQVLELEDVEDVENAHLVDICGLLYLRHLGLKGTPITEIPQQIGRLLHLETLDVRGTGVTEIPQQIGRLLHLETLDVRGTGVTELPWEAGKLPKQVRVFAGNEDSRQGIKLPEGVCQALEDSIPKSSLANCKVLSIPVLDCFGLGTVPPEVAVFKVPGRHMDIPCLIKQHFNVLSSMDIRLCKLGEDDLKFLQEMPKLKTLVVRFEVVPVVPIPISTGGFMMLECFYIDSRVPRVTFGSRAMPKLKRLVFKFYAGPASEDSMGITHLQSLEVVIFRCSPWYRSDSPGIGTTVAVVRKEAQEHPNRITLCINDKEEIFPEKQSAQVNEDAGRSGSSGVEAAKKTDMHPVSACQNSSLAGDDAVAGCSGTSEIEEVEAQ